MKGVQRRAPSGNSPSHRGRFQSIGAAVTDGVGGVIRVREGTAHYCYRGNKKTSQQLKVFRVEATTPDE